MRRLHSTCQLHCIARNVAVLCTCITRLTSLAACRVYRHMQKFQGWHPVSWHAIMLAFTGQISYLQSAGQSGSVHCLQASPRAGDEESCHARDAILSSACWDSPPCEHMRFAASTWCRWHRTFPQVLFLVHSMVHMHQICLSLLSKVCCTVKLMVLSSGSMYMHLQQSPGSLSCH